jgi:hypothetical protein
VFVWGGGKDLGRKRERGRRSSGELKTLVANPVGVGHRDRTKPSFDPQHIIRRAYDGTIIPVVGMVCKL